MVLGAAGYIWTASKPFLAAHAAAALSRPGLERAIRLDYGNAEYHDLLGRYLVLNSGDIDPAVAQYRIATSLNPHGSRYWLDFAAAALVAGQPAEQQAALQHALATNPTNPEVAWDAANFYLVQGDSGPALPLLRIVLQFDPATRGNALRMGWHAVDGNIDTFLAKAVPADTAIYLDLLQFLVQQRQTAAAIKVWQNLLALNQPFDATKTFGYIRALISDGQPDTAARAWQELTARDPRLRPYGRSENLVVNGGFEQELLNGGFDWQYAPVAHLTVGVDTAVLHSGTRSLSLSFDGAAVPDPGIGQFVPVKPNTAYEFTAAYKCEDLESASGPRFLVQDTYSNHNYVLTDDFLGSSPWREQSVRFRTGPDTRLLTVKITREPGDPLIRGRFWVDDVRIVEK